MENDTDLIEALGGGTAVAAWLTEQTGKHVDRESVYKWRQNGVAWKYRPLIASLARNREVRLPPDFLPTLDKAG